MESFDILSRFSSLNQEISMVTVSQKGAWRNVMSLYAVLFGKEYR